MEFESPDVAKDFPGLYASGNTKRSDSDYSDEDKVSRIDILGKKKEKKDSKKEKGYKVFEGESSDDELNEARSPGKSKKIKSSFKFPGKDKRDKHSKGKDAKDKKEEKEKVCKKESKETKKDNKDSKRDAKKESKEGDKTKIKKKKEHKILKIKEKKKKNSVQDKEEKPIFGIQLQLAVERSGSHDGICIPVIVRECIDYIEEHGLTCEGIYRISGLKSKVRQLKDQYNRGEKVYLYEHEPHIVASLLKQFLRDLPEPILTSSLTPKFEEAAALKNTKKQVEMLQKLLQELPSCNRLLLSWMVIHMLHIVALEKRNKMNLQNVYIVLSPTMQISHNILQALFAHSEILFSGIELKKYVPPIDLDSSRLSLELPDSPTAIATELSKQENILNVLHAELNTGLRDQQKEEQLWEIQRVVTQLKRKLRFLRQVQDTSCASFSCEIQNLNNPSDVSNGTVLADAVNQDALNQTLEPETIYLNKENVSDQTEMQIPKQTDIDTENNQVNKNITSNSDSQVEPVDKQLTSTNSDCQTHDQCLNENELKNSEKEYVAAMLNSSLTDSIENISCDKKNLESDITDDELKESLTESPTPTENKLEALRLEERLLRIKSDELILLSDELRKKILSERQEIARLKMEIQEYERFYKFKKYSFDSTENSSLDSGDESSSSCGDEDLQDILLYVIAENKEIETKNDDVLIKIQAERERIIHAKVEMKLMMQNRLMNSNVNEEHLI